MSLLLTDLALTITPREYNTKLLASMTANSYSCDEISKIMNDYTLELNMARNAANTHTEEELIEELKVDDLTRKADVDGDYQIHYEELRMTTSSSASPPIRRSAHGHSDGGGEKAARHKEVKAARHRALEKLEETPRLVAAWHRARAIGKQEEPDEQQEEPTLCHADDGQSMSIAHHADDATEENLPANHGAGGPTTCRAGDRRQSKSGATPDRRLSGTRAVARTWRHGHGHACTLRSATELEGTRLRLPRSDTWWRRSIAQQQAAHGSSATRRPTTAARAARDRADHPDATDFAATLAHLVDTPTAAQHTPTRCDLARGRSPQHAEEARVARAQRLETAWNFAPTRRRSGARETSSAPRTTLLQTSSRQAPSPSSQGG